MFLFSDLEPVDFFYYCLNNCTLDFIMLSVEKELEKLHESLGLSDTIKKSKARDSGIPDSRHTTIGDRSLGGNRAKPKSVKKTANFLEDDEPIF